MGGGLGNREEHFSLGGGKDVGQGSLEGRRKLKVSTPWPLCLCGVELFFFFFVLRFGFVFVLLFVLAESEVPRKQFGA